MTMKEHHSNYSPYDAFGTQIDWPLQQRAGEGKQQDRRTLKRKGVLKRQREKETCGQNLEEQGKLQELAIL